MKFLSCLYLNARSVVKKMDYLIATVHYLHPDIVAVTESWATGDMEDGELGIMGYKLFRCDRQTSCRGGGVLLYVSDVLKAEGVNILHTYPEHIWCQIRSSSRTSLSNLVIGVIYRTPNESIYGSELHGQLRDVLAEVGQKQAVVFGDFNYREIDWDSLACTTGASIECREFLQSVLEMGYCQHVHEPTRQEGVLDLILSTDEALIDEVVNLGRFDTSDHDMLHCNINWRASVEHRQQSRFNYSRVNMDGLMAELKGVDWGSRLNGAVDQAWQTFRDLLTHLEERFVPVCNVKLKKKEPWMTYKAFRMVEKKHRLYNRYKDNTHPAYIKASREAKKELKKSRVNFETKLAENIDNDKKSFFSYVRNKMGGRSVPDVIVDSDGMRLENGPEIVEAFNNYFTSVFAPENDIDELDEMVIPMKSANTVSYVPISEEQVRRKLKSLRSDKSPGPDDLSPRFLHLIADELVRPLTILFNKSLATGSVPEDWHQANVSVIHKKGSRTSTENYRPISLTSQICKVMESIIRDILLEHLEGNRLINNTQHGFRKGRSCISNLLMFLDEVTKAVDEGSAVDIAYFDFAKAFDVVPHGRLIKKVESCGITGPLLQWIRDWLNNRTQRVCINGFKSSWGRVSSGVPQGSVLGPILFLIFIDDIDTGVENLLLKFADDTKLVGRIRGPEDIAKLQKDIDALVEWARTWRMRFNIDKCKIIHVGRNNTHANYRMDDTTLQKVTEEKDLGVTISDDLKPSKHCRIAFNKSAKMSALIRRTVAHRTPFIMLRLYKALVRPHVEYGMAVWSPWYIKDKELIERVQRRFTKSIRGLQSMDYNQRLVKLGLWTLEERRNRNDLIEVYKMIHGHSSIPLDTFFVLRNNKRTRGHKYTLYKKACCRDVRAHFFSGRVVNRWNRLTEEVVDVGSINGFKRGLERVRRQEIGFFMDT